MPHVSSDTMFDVKGRAISLSYESKTSTFMTASRKSLRILQEIGTKDLSMLDPKEQQFLNHFVAGVVVDITPTDPNHINPTFAFCKSLGLKKNRVQTSIADGCYRSLWKFSTDRDVQQKLEENNKDVSRTDTAKDPSTSTLNPCPYFKIGQLQFTCPFAERHSSDEANAVYEACKRDPVHVQDHS